MYPVRGERDFQQKYKDPLKQKIRDRKWKKNFRKTDEGRKRMATNQAKYRATLAKAKKRPWEKWEDDFLRANFHLPSRVIAFALDRGLQSVQLQRAGAGKNAERVRLWRLKRKKAALQKGTKQQILSRVCMKKLKPLKGKETGISKPGNKRNET